MNYSVERGEHEPSKFLNNTVRCVKDEHDKVKVIASRFIEQERSKFLVV